MPLNKNLKYVLVALPYQKSLPVPSFENFEKDVLNSGRILVTYITDPNEEVFISMKQQTVQKAGSDWDILKIGVLIEYPQNYYLA